jgi:plastocyanin
MRRLFLLFCLALIGGPAPAQEWRLAPEYDVLLSSYDIAPRVIRLKAGEPVRLRFVNNTTRGHSFSAKDLFRSAQIRRRDADMVKDGRITVPALSAETIAFVPKAGRYKAGAPSFIHRLLGMKATVIVE